MNQVRFDFQIRRETAKEQHLPTGTHRRPAAGRHLHAIEETVPATAHPHNNMDRYGTGVHRCRLHPGVRLVRHGRLARRLRYDLLRRGQRDLLTALRLRHEVHRKGADHHLRRHRAHGAANMVVAVEATSRQSDRLLHRLRTLGCRRFRLADASQWLVSK